MNCPKCQRETWVTFDYDNIRTGWCNRCQSEFNLGDASQSCQHAPQRRPEYKVEYETEAALVKAIKDALEKRGWTVCRTGQYVPHGAGNEVGLPDLYLTHPHLDGFWRAYEVKLPCGRVSPEQQKHVDAGRVMIVRSVEDALRGVGE